MTYDRSHSSPSGARSANFLSAFCPQVDISCPAMWGQISAACAEKVVAKTPQNRVFAKNVPGNHPGKRAHTRENTRILSPNWVLKPDYPQTRDRPTGKVFV